MEWKSDPVLVDVDDPVPGPGQVVVRVGGAGACHSDLHLMREFEGGLLPWGPPFTLGHRGQRAGSILWARGSPALRWASPSRCTVLGVAGTAPHCRLGIESYCENPADAPVPMGGGGLGLDGGMAEFMLVPAARHLIPLPDGLDPISAAPLTDAGLTPYHAVRRSWAKLAPGTTSVVIGAGGLGHLGIQILKATTATRVIAVDTRDEALALAREYGADLTIVPGPEAAAEIRAATGGRGADVVLDLSDPSPPWPSARPWRACWAISRSSA